MIVSTNTKCCPESAALLAQDQLLTFLSLCCAEPGRGHCGQCARPPRGSHADVSLITKPLRQQRCAANNVGCLETDRGPLLPAPLIAISLHQWATFYSGLRALEFGVESH